MASIRFIKHGTWWTLPLHKKILRWLRYVPFSYIKAIYHVYPAWKENRVDVTFGEAFDLLVSLGEVKLDRWDRLVNSVHSSKE